MFRSPLYLFWTAPALALAGACLFWAGNRRKKLSRLFGRLPTLARLTRAETPRRRKFKSVLEASALLMLLLALAGPQWGVELVPTLSRTHQVVIAVDLSLSMLAPDVRPSRLDKAKGELSLLLDRLKGNRVGVVAFAGDAAVLCPVTTDVEAAKQVLGSLAVGTIPRPGTAIGKAIRRATLMLARHAGGKTIVLLSDGEDHKTQPLEAAAAAAGEGVRIFTIGIGSPDGEPLPLKDENGNMTGYKKDRSGKTVVSRLMESTLREIAEKTGGAYFRSTPGEEEVSEITRLIFAAEKSEGIRGSATQYKNRFLLPLALAFFILLLELLIAETAFASMSLAQEASPAASAGATGKSVRAAALLAAFLPWPSGTAAAAGAEGHLRKGNALYGEEKYVPALEDYAKANKAKPQDPRPIFNAGDALYRIKEMDQAAAAFKSLDVPAVNNETRAAALYNLGNIHFQKEDYGTAVKAYRQALIRHPEDPDIRHNLAIALRRKRQPPPKKKKDDKKDKDKDNKDKKDKPEPKEDKKSQPPEPAARPQDQLSREDAERILRSAGEKEKEARQRAQQRPVRSKPPDVKEDW